jgi:hypothetical protein
MSVGYLGARWYIFLSTALEAAQGAKKRMGGLRCKAVAARRRRTCSPSTTISYKP